MKKEKSDKDSELTAKVSETHVTTYLNKIKIGLLLTLCFITITEFVIFFLVKYGLLANTMTNEFMQNRWKADGSYVIKYLIKFTIINWGIYFIYFFLDKYLPFQPRNFLVCTIFILLISVYAFMHSGFIHLSFLYVIPIIFTCPLGKKYQIGTLIVSLILACIYTTYQYILMGTGYNFLIGTQSLTAIITTYLICHCVYSSFTHALNDIEEYTKLSSKLYDEIGHDYVTGALSKVALHKDIADDNTYRSIAFIDLDDFKEVNDTKGHATGDSVLRTLVESSINKNERIYRYGGDEFIVLSKLKEYDLYTKLLQIKTLFTDTCKRELDYDITFSAGIKPVTPNSDIEQIITESDKVMYISKKNGKDQITVAE